MPTDEEAFDSGPSPDVAKLVREAVQAERERIAKLLHATTCQDLTGGYLMVCATAKQSRKSAPELEQKLSGIADKLQEAGEGLRNLLRSLQSDEHAGENDS